MPPSNQRSIPFGPARGLRAPPAIIARYVVLEAARMRLPWFLLAAFGGVWAAAYFAQALAITDAARMQTAFVAAGARVVCVFTLAMFVLVSTLREAQDKGLELILSFELPRSHYVLGKLAGIVALAWLSALAAAVFAVWYAPVPAVVQWGVSLGLELSLIGALALFCVVTFNQFIPAAGLVLGFYILGRAIGAIELMSAPHALAQTTVTSGLVSLGVQMVALLVPGLDNYTQTAWLVDDPTAWLTLAAQAGKAALYVALLTAAAMFDFYRRNL